MRDEQDIEKGREIVRAFLEKFAREHPEEWAAWQAEAREGVERVVGAQAEAAADLAQCGYDWPSVEDTYAIAQDLGMPLEQVDAGQFTIADLRKLAGRFARAIRGAELRQKAIERLTKAPRGKEETADHEAEKKPRATKQETALKTMAAIAYKIEKPGATEAECATAAGIPRSTLAARAEWQEWAPKVEQAAASGQITRLKAAYEKRLDRIVATEE